MTALHPGSWVVWAAGVGVFAAAVTNPWGIVAALLVVVIVHAGTPGGTGTGLKGLIVAMTFLTLVRLMMVVTLPNPGATELFRLPEFQLWSNGFRIGGAVTAEIVAETLTESLRLGLAMSGFGVFIARVDTAAIIRMFPSSLREVGLVCGVAVGFVSGIVESAKDIRDAQRMRGETTGRFLPPSMVVPILGSAIERAFNLAESIDSRGYGTGAARISPTAIVLGSFLALGGLIVWTAGVRTPGVALVIAAILVITGAIGSAARRSATTRMPGRRMRIRDVAVIGTVATATVAVLLDPSSWTAYPVVSMPPATIGTVLASIAFLAPLVGSQPRVVRTAGFA